MIKGSLLVSIPIIRRFLVKNFLSENAYFLISVSDPLGKNPGRICLKLTDTSFPARPYILPYMVPNSV